MTTVNYTSLLGLALPTTGDLSGSWGNEVNNFITQYIDSAVAGTQVISGSQTAVTLSPTNGSSLAQVGSGLTGSSQYGIIRCSGNPASTLTITVSYSSLTNAQFSQRYAVINATSTNQSVIVRATTSSGTSSGVTLVAGESAVLAWNGSDFIKVATSAVDGVSTISFGTTGLTPSTATSGAVTVAGTLAVANGGTGVTTSTGSGSNVLSNSPVLTTPNLGTPSAATLTNATGLPLTTGVTGTLPVANGGTGATSLTANNVILGNGTSAVQFVAPGTNGNVLTSNGTTWTSAVLPAGGLTYVYTTTPITLTDKQGALTDTSGGSFTVTLPATPATGAQVVVADAGSNWGTNNLTVGRNGSTIGGLAENLVCDITGASVQLVYDGSTWEVYAQVGGNGGNAVTLSGTQTLTNKTIAFGSNTLSDVASLSTAQTFTGTKTFAGTSSALAAILNDAAEVVTISATAATGTINYDVTTQSVLFYTSNASANWTVNLRGSSGTSMNTLMSTGQSVTVAFLVTQGSTAYFNSSVQVDGTTSGVTTRWQGGTAPAAGNASGVDVYVYTVIKTANATFSVFASQTRFA